MLVAVGNNDTRDEGDDDSAVAKVLAALSAVLERLVSRNDAVEELEKGSGGGGEGKTAVGKLKVFNGVRAPAITISKYLERIYKYSKCSPACFVVAYIYIDRLLHRHPASLLLSLNVHRILVTAIMIASKVLDDEHYNNAFYAKVGGVSNAELNKLELELLFMLDFEVVVCARVYEIYYLYLDKEIAGVDGIAHNLEKGVADVESISYHDIDNAVDDSQTYQ